MSRPTEIMLVASATSTGFGIAAKDGFEALLRPRHLIGRDARGELHRLLDGAIGKRAVRRVDPPPLRAVARGAIAHLVLDDPARAAELAQRVEVAERRHVGIGGVLAGLRRRGFASYSACAAASSVVSARRKTSFGPRPCAAMPR